MTRISEYEAELIQKAQLRWAKALRSLALADRALAAAGMKTYLPVEWNYPVPRFDYVMSGPTGAISLFPTNFWN